jgi:hypothetical protein
LLADELQRPPFLVDQHEKLIETDDAEPLNGKIGNSLLYGKSESTKELEDLPYTHLPDLGSEWSIIPMENG